MVAATRYDALAGIILHSTPADMHTVIVDGILRKKDGGCFLFRLMKQRNKSRVRLNWTGKRWPGKVSAAEQRFKKGQTISILWRLVLRFISSTMWTSHA